MVASRLLLTAFLVSTPLLHAQQTDDQIARERMHQSVDWLAVAPHLPDPQTATPLELQTAGDVLRARKLPDDALDYYHFALDRGGDRATLLNRIGITDLELRHLTVAKLNFRQALALNPRSAEGWNNLGATEYVMGDFNSSIYDYRKAVKLSKKTAIFHSNLGTSLFEQKDYEGARAQFQIAVKLDPKVLERGGSGGLQAHIMGSQDRGRFCFEMATLAARTGNDDSVVEWLSRAAEAGENIHWSMQGVKEFTPYLHDQRVEMIIHNAKMMRAHQLAVATPVPALPPSSSQQY